MASRSAPRSANTSTVSLWPHAAATITAVEPSCEATCPQQPRPSHNAADATSRSPPSSNQHATTPPPSPPRPTGDARTLSRAACGAGAQLVGENAGLAALHAVTASAHNVPVQRRALIEQPAGLGGVPGLRRPPESSCHCTLIRSRGGHAVRCAGWRASAGWDGGEQRRSLAVFAETCSVSA